MENLISEKINSILVKYLTEIVAMVNKGSHIDEVFAYNFFINYRSSVIFLESFKDLFNNCLKDISRTNPYYRELKISLEKFLDTKSLDDFRIFTLRSTHLLEKIKGKICDDCNLFCNQSRYKCV